jgi:excinuclease ABC subunit C
MEEVLTRRLRAFLADEEHRPASGMSTGLLTDADAAPGGTEADGAAGGPDGAGPADDDHVPERTRRRFAYPPQLLLLDGGLGQLNVGVRVLADMGLTDRIPIASLAKSFEEVYRPGSSEPLRLNRQSEALYLLQRLRDEAHRFAISYHRTLRGKRMTLGALDGVTGLGPKRRTRLIEQFGGLGTLRNASKEELLGVSWLPAEVGVAVYDRLHTPLAPSGTGTDGRKVDG